MEEGEQQVEEGGHQVEEEDHQVEDEEEEEEQMAVLSVLLASVCEKVDQVTLEKHQMGAPVLPS